MRRVLSCIASSGIALCAIALSAGAEETGWFVSGSVGQSRFGNGSDTGSSGLLVSSKTHDVQAGAALGYRFSPNVSLEGGYASFGKATFTRVFPGVGTCVVNNPQCATVSGETKITAAHLSLLASAPLTDGWSIYGRAGAARVDRDVTIGSAGPSKEKKTDGLFGVGAAFRFSPQAAGTLEWQKLTDINVQAINVGVRLSF